MRPKKLFPRKKYFPRLTARNAYQLLDDVATAILTEPKRLDMKSWVQSALYLGGRRKSAVPACQTVACCAGWIVGLAKRDTLIACSVSGNDDVISRHAVNLLGWDSYDTSVFAPLFRADGVDIERLTPGTLAYAEAVVRRIRDFQATHASRLLVTEIKGGL